MRSQLERVIFHACKISQNILYSHICQKRVNKKGGKGPGILGRKEKGKLKNDIAYFYTG